VFAWDPTQYSKFDRQRLRPAFDLLDQIHHDGPSLVYDLGTGRGQMARVMAERWPGAEVIGTDTSPEMLAEASVTPSRVRWVEHDVRDWDPPEPPDIIYSNAMLHWVPDHDELLVKLARSLRSGGVLAIQMPLSWGEPSHRLMREVLAGKRGEPIGPSELRTRMARRPVAEPAHYHRLLRSVCVAVEVWKTVFHQELTGDDAVLEWVTGTGLRPVLEALEGDDRDFFLDIYRAELGAAYPPEQDGTTMYPFPRLFIVANQG